MDGSVFPKVMRDFGERTTLESAKFCLMAVKLLVVKNNRCQSEGQCQVQPWSQDAELSQDHTLVKRLEFCGAAVACVWAAGQRWRGNLSEAAERKGLQQGCPTKILSGELAFHRVPESGGQRSSWSENAKLRNSLRKKFCAQSLNVRIIHARANVRRWGVIAAANTRQETQLQGGVRHGS